MTTAMQAGQLLVVGFEGITAPPELLSRIAEGRVGGVILFSRNLGNVGEIAELTRSLHAVTPKGDPPLIVSVDQEGGRVQRIKSPLTLWPAMAKLGERNDEALSSDVGRALGKELAALGFNLDYAPVLDVHTNPQNPVIGDRAFGTIPHRAAGHALAFWRGLEEAGVRGCGKHYPGHGDTATDSHRTLPQVDHDETRLRTTELAPFRAAVAVKVPMLMTAHVVYPAIDALPATLSKKWLTDILRGELGYDGVIVSDDLDMKAVAERFTVEETVTRSLMAGADCFLACRDPQIQTRAEAALTHAARGEGDVRMRESVARVRAFRATLQGVPASNAHAGIDRMLEPHAALATRARG